MPGQCIPPPGGGSVTRRQQRGSHRGPAAWGRVQEGPTGAGWCGVSGRVSPFQAQSSARSLQAELEKLRPAESAAASGTEEAQHLKVIWLPPCSLRPRLGTRHKKPFPSRTMGVIFGSWGWWGRVDSSHGRCSLP